MTDEDLNFVMNDLSKQYFTGEFEKMLDVIRDTTNHDRMSFVMRVAMKRMVEIPLKEAASAAIAPDDFVRESLKMGAKEYAAYLMKAIMAEYPEMVVDMVRTKMEFSHREYVNHLNNPHQPPRGNDMNVDLSAFGGNKKITE